MENFRSNLKQSPPCVVFTICLFLFALTLMGLGIYVKFNDVENRDIKDWNSFLGRISKMQFCVVNTSVDNWDIESNYTLHSLEVDISLTTTADIIAVHNGIYVLGTILSSQLDYHDLSNERLFVLFEIPSIRNITLTCTAKDFDMSFKACAYLWGPERLFPAATARQPAACRLTNASINEHTSVGQTSSAPDDLAIQLASYSRLLRVWRMDGQPRPSAAVSHNLDFLAHHSSRGWCTFRSRLYHPTNLVDQNCTYSTILNKIGPSLFAVTISHTKDLQLVTFLSADDRTMVQLHLLYTSCFLGALAVAVMLYAVLRRANIRLAASANLSKLLES